MSVTLALDMMGGDCGLQATVPAAITSRNKTPDLSLILVGQSEKILEQLGSVSDERLSIQHSTELVEMDEMPAKALRTKKDSSMRVAINLVHTGKADACVSAGNTGALMATAHFVLKTLPGINRPAICGVLPRADGQVHMIDLGANIQCSANLLLQFGFMASILVRYLDKIGKPTVGLLNIGLEDMKGNEVIKEASELFRSSGLNYMGFVEGDQIFSGEVDIIVCDGFSGNVALKTSEGLAQMLTRMAREEFTKNGYSRVSGALAKPVMKSLLRRIDHRRYNGAAFLGLRGTVIKSHGGADSIAFSHAIDVARRSVETNLVKHIAEELPQSMLIDAKEK